MPHLYVQVTMPHKNAIPKDSVVNTFHFSGIDDLEDMVSEITGRLNRFWNSMATGASVILKNFYSTEMNIEGTRAKFYDWSDPEPRAPIADVSLGISAPSALSSIALPGEVSLCTSYAAELISGAPPARRRGRLYLGPFNQGALNTSTNTASRPIGTLLVTAAQVAKALAGENTLGAEWQVWSRVGGNGAEVVRGWVDNAWDTQRRRGVIASTRNTWVSEL